MKDEALRLALEALGHFEKAGLATLKTIDAIAAIKKALEQPEPEYAIRLVAHGAEPVLGWSQHWSNFPINTKFYTSPPKREWQGLTDEEREERINWAISLDNTTYSNSLARAIEAKLKEKNT